MLLNSSKGDLLALATHPRQVGLKPDDVLRIRRRVGHRGPQKCDHREQEVPVRVQVHPVGGLQVVVPCGQPQALLVDLDDVLAGVLDVRPHPLRQEDVVVEQAQLAHHGVPVEGVRLPVRLEDGPPAELVQEIQQRLVTSPLQDVWK